MSIIPSFETVAIVGDNQRLVAELVSLFTRTDRYVAVLDGPRMGRPDAINEVVRLNNALVMAKPRCVLFANISSKVLQEMSIGWPSGMAIPVTSVKAATYALKGWVKGPSKKMEWGCDNLGLGLLLARRAKKQLVTSTEPSPNTTFVKGNRHLLIVCEDNMEPAQICASCLAFATEASLLLIPHQSENERGEWLEELYGIGSNGDVSARFADIRQKVRARLPIFEFKRYKQILFVTSGFPWGIAISECATTHMYGSPNLGRSIIKGLWVAQNSLRSARNALLIDPAKVEGTEIQDIANSLYNNRTLIRVVAGPRATVHKIQTLVEILAFDIIVISTHAGDASGERATYKYVDSEGINRCLVVDHARSFGYDPKTDKVAVVEYERFFELDGVSWSDTNAKKKLYVGKAIYSWAELGGVEERNKYKIATEAIPRVTGSMALQMYDHVWMPMIQEFPPDTAPFILNNACSSWHALGERFMFAGARAYIGALFPIMDAEAQVIGREIFQTRLGESLSNSLWAAQKKVYGDHGRWPYVMVGLPFSSVQPNTTKSVDYMAQQYKKAITAYDFMSSKDPSVNARKNAARYRDFLRDDFEETFTKDIVTKL